MIIYQYDPEYLEPLHQAFIRAFSDYKFQFQPTLEEFALRISSKLSLRPELSALAFEGKVAIGFALHTLGMYNGRRTVYNGGTGVVPEHRRKGTAMKLFEHVFPAIEKTGAERIVLEVIVTNKQAIQLYENLGFRYVQTFRCMRLSCGVMKGSSAKEIVVHKEWDPDRYRKIRSFTTSFLDADEQLRHNFHNELLLEYRQDGNVQGYIVFQPSLGRISQFAVAEDHRNHGIGKQLLAQCVLACPDLDITILNIPESETDTVRALEALGFKHQVDQYEMDLLI